MWHWLNTSAGGVPPLVAAAAGTHLHATSPEPNTSVCAGSRNDEACITGYVSSAAESAARPERLLWPYVAWPLGASMLGSADASFRGSRRTRAAEEEQNSLGVVIHDAYLGFSPTITLMTSSARNCGCTSNIVANPFSWRDDASLRAMSCVRGELPCAIWIRTPLPIEMPMLPEVTSVCGACISHEAARRQSPMIRTRSIASVSETADIENTGRNMPPSRALTVGAVPR